MFAGRSTVPEGALAPSPTVLVLGAGFIGGAVAGALLERGCPVRVITRSELDDGLRARLSGANVFIGDAREMGSLAAALNGVDHVVYALGSSSPVESDLDPANDVELIVPPLIRLLELLRLRSHVGITFLSSGGTVYGDKLTQPIAESEGARPISSYGIIKLTCENYVSMYADSHEIPAQILRIGNAYGPGQRPVRGQGLVAQLMLSATTGEPPPLFGSPEAVRDYVYIDDIARAVADLVCTPAVPRVVNIGSGRGYSVRQVVELVEEVTGRELTVRPQPSRACDVRANVLDITRLRATVPFEPLELRAGIERTWKATLDGDLPEPRPPRFPAGAPH
jgi:UDP-glucose 4-epimerase